MKIIVRWTNESRGTVESELSGTWDRTTGTAIFEEFHAAKLEINGKSAQLFIDGHEERGYVWSATDEEIVVHIPAS